MPLRLASQSLQVSAFILRDRDRCLGILAKLPLARSRTLAEVTAAFETTPQS